MSKNKQILLTPKQLQIQSLYVLGISDFVYTIYATNATKVLEHYNHFDLLPNQPFLVVDKVKMPKAMPLSPKIYYIKILSENSLGWIRVLNFPQFNKLNANDYK